MRAQIIRNIIIFLFILIAVDLFYLQVVRGGYFYRLSQGNSIRAIPFEGKRGQIFDRNGKVLAESVKAYQVAFIPQDVQNKKAAFSFLGTVLNEDVRAIEARYFRNKLTPFSPVIISEGISRQQAIMIEENAYLFPGLIVLETYQRHYPYAAAGAHVIGYVGKADRARLQEITEYGYSAEEFVGYSGVEESYDEMLRGQPGGRQIEVNSRGQQVRLLSVREPSEGKNIVLTVDQRIQRTAQQVLGGQRGAVVILDSNNGEILAMVSSPAFDPNVFVNKDMRSRVSEYLQGGASPLLNRAISGAFPPGSVFKIPVAMGGLEERKITPSTTFNCPGSFELGNRVYQFNHAYGPQDLTQAMGHSANEYFFHIGLLLGPELMAKYARAFSFGERTGVDLPYEARGSLPSRTARWYKGDTVNMSIGQGSVLATPLQLARMIATVANEGRVIQPHIVKSVGGVDSFRLSEGARFVVFRKDVWQAIHKALYAVVKMDTGTATVLQLPGMDTFGKTGTAQAGSGKEDHAWFAGVTKTEKRKIAYCFLLEHGGSSANACQLTRDFLLSLQEQGII